MVHTGLVTHHSNSPGNSWGTAPLPDHGTAFAQAPQANTGAPRRKSGLWWKILAVIVIVVVVLAAVAEFGLRTYLKSQVANEMRDSASQQGIELSGDPKVSFGSSPLVLGLVRGTIPSLSVELPSSLNISYQDADRSRPEVKGQPAASIDLKDLEVSGDNPKARGLTLQTTLPEDYLLAVINQSTAQKTSDQGANGAAGQATADSLLAGLVQVTAVKANPDAGTLDIELSGGLATLSMTPKAVDGALSFEVADVKIFGMSLPQELVASVSESLTQSVEKTENLAITDAEITSDGLKVRLEGSDVRIDDIASEVNSSRNTTLNGAGKSGNGATSAGTTGA